ncbi:MAG: glycosyltransferase family 4 protein [Chitinophagaceae bacterium]|nr:glycosyltransferase family 4 protein [Chitinophagaceae bacterium]
MKIVHCLFTIKTGGAQILVVDMLNEMSMYHDVSLIIVNDQLNENILSQLNRNVKLYLINRKEGSINPLPVLKLNLLLLKLKPDIIHCHEANMAKFIKVAGGKLVYTIHDVGIPVSLYHHFDSVIAISGAVYADVVTRITGDIKKVFNGIPVGSFQKRKEYGLRNEERYRLVQVSRLMHTKKGQDVLVKALHKVVYELGFVNISLDLIGSGDSAEYLYQLVEELNLGQHIRFLGEKDRNWLFANLSKYHLLVQPSFYEGFGLTVLEGLAAGIPVLASNIDGPAEIIAQTSGGFLFEKGNVESCAGEIFKLIQMYENRQVGEMMRHSTLRVHERYSIQSCVRGYLQEYTYVLRPKHLKLQTA